MEFMGVRLEPCSKVYKPCDDSFILGEALAAEVRKGEKVLDMGTGTGIQAMIAASRGGEVTAVDINNKAIECLRYNAELNKLEIRIIKSNLFSEINYSFDLIVFNPPYLPEDEMDPEDELTLAWDGGKDGREVVDRFLEQFESNLNREGRVLLIQSSLNGLDSTMEKFKELGFKPEIILQKNFFFEKLYVIRAGRLP
ncbi:MAG TPA: methyltransferase domain-containing protein [Euryarchaeota archaeon]|nr:methyltransferase domain-containing protein [Euryarchaeota archaeon]